MICQHLGPKFIKLPLSENEVKHLTYCFKKVLCFPQCLGAVDGTHVNIKTPKNNSIDFRNRKGHDSINVQTRANCNYCFFFFNGVEAFMMFGYEGILPSTKC